MKTVKNKIETSMLKYKTEVNKDWISFILLCIYVKPYLYKIPNQLLTTNINNNIIKIISDDVVVSTQSMELFFYFFF